MAQRDSSLGTARLIATMMYVGPLVLLPWVGRYLRVGTSLDPKVLPVLAAALLVVGVVDYGVSLLLEAKLLARAEGGDPRGVVSAAAVTAAFGASLAVYGLVLTLLGAPAWGAAFYALCAVHGLHLMMRWPNYAQAVEQSDQSA